MKREQVEKVQEILGPRFKRNFWSHLRPFLIYRAQKDAVSDAEISRIIAQLLSSQLYPKIQEHNGYLYIHVASRIRTERRPKVWINIVLFFLTVITTLMAGSMLSGWEYFSDFSLILHGWKYSFAVLTILTAHEMGHYLAARYHKMNVTLPYYIPLPLPGFNFGTLGAFIKIRSPIPHRRALLQVGAFGPLAGFIVSLVFLAIGYAWLPDFKGIVAYVE
ncbi:MAG: site-2 protease family protein [Desulfobacterales bacterium]